MLYFKSCVVFGTFNVSPELTSSFPQIYAVKELTGLLQNKDGPNHTVMFNIPYLQVPITHHDFRLVKFTIGISSFIDLFLNITSEVSK